ncbi:glycosyltransferase family 39 protein [uncultured Massilia sp.]|uniref:glycosyltransferase family 39 protein n=1 Tax=uncultured Massilia sp. TaxID=169973 RepID=UPI0025FD2479|nr:glycosyltransferase family 39 protein [uncultured Massilia sp.]
MTKHLPAEHADTALQHLVSSRPATPARPAARAGAPVVALVLALAAGFVLVTLYVLSLRTLVPPDEGRYAEMAREMFAGGDWITTRLNGIKYFEKPPLQTWMNALTFAAFGLGEWQARLWTGLCAIFGVLMTGLAGARVFGARTGLHAALVLGACLYWVAGGQVDSLDMGLSAMMTLALCALLLAQRPGIGERARRHWMLACWAGMALAVLAKGLIGIVLPGAALVAYALAARDTGIWKRLHIARGLPLFLLVAAPWFVLVGLRNPEQPHFFFIHEHVERFLLKEHHREAPWWYFLALLAVGSIPWLGLLAHGLAAGARRDAADSATFRPRLLALAWVVVIVAFFSASSSKLPGYILPAFPALALLLGRYAGEAPRRVLAANALLAGLAGIALLAAAACAGSFARIPAEAAAYRAWTPWIAAGGLAMLGGAGAALWDLRRGRARARLLGNVGGHVSGHINGHVLAIALGGFLAGQLLMAGFGPVAALRTGANLLPALRATLTPATRLYSVGMYEQALTFYLGRTVTLVDYEDEFAFGLAQQPELAMPTLDAFAARWTRDARAGIPGVAIIRPDLVGKLRARGVPLRVVAADARRSVIATP